MVSLKKSEGIAKHLWLTLLFSVVFYFGAFSWIQHLRDAKGPWEVAFASDSGGQPSIFVTQRTLHIFQRLQFPGERIDRANLDVNVQFREGVTNLPFGEILFQEPLYLPGTATMRLFGHVVQLMPRVLIIDDKELAWRSGKDIVVPHRTG